ncbi:hypothetical protein ILUMI_08770 [Ignelater luminosus]|uniref:Cytochrome P450 n=1 Tax=Ignelater luminosus TaxID=2038154 RepID=A0A8K0GFN5_IGNLU|nr:hypothetical protein ILUMI_08770 [Ignelater luminosus]
MAILTGNIYIDILAIAVSIFAVIVSLFKWWFGYWERQGVYTPKPTIPFGNAKDLLFQRVTTGVEYKNVYDDIKRKGNKFGGYYFFGIPIFIPVDLDLVKLMLTKDFRHFTNHLNTVNVETDPLSGHLFNLKNAEWKNLRAKLTPTFTSGKMKMMFQTLVNCSDSLTTVIDRYSKEKQAIDIKDIVARFTTDIIGSCAFGIECNSLQNPNSEFRIYGKKVFEITWWESFVRLVAIGWPDVLTHLKLRAFSKEICEFFMNVVRGTVDYREKNDIIRRDFMHLLIQLKNNVKIEENNLGKLKSNLQSNGNISSNSSNELSLTMNELTAQAFVFFIAGFETSSTTTTFCLYELVQNPELQEKVRQEINTVLEKYDGKVTYDAVMEMPYLEKCINEALRKYPPVPLHTRECTEDYTVPGTDIVLKKGTSVFIPVMGIQNDPEYFPNPDKFDPERFSEENKAKRHSAAWTPFGDGPRACIGLRFGLMQTKVGLITLLNRFRFTLHPNTKLPLCFDPKGFVLTADNGIWLNAERI